MDVAIIGAGETGSLLAHQLARRVSTRSVRLIDESGRIAEGQALDIRQAGAVEGFATPVAGSTNLSDAVGADIIVVADKRGGGEWDGDEARSLLGRLSHSANALIVCAGASHRPLVEWGVRERHIARGHMVGSAPQALVTAAQALVALALDRSPRDVALTVVGVPPAQIVVGWGSGSVQGSALTRVLGEPVRRQLSARIPALWPPGPLALALAAVQVIDAALRGSRQSTVCFVAPDDSSGRRVRAAALPVRFGTAGLEVLLPQLDVAEQVALDNAMLL